jgi:hypothetical protein
MKTIKTSARPFLEDITFIIPSSRFAAHVSAPVHHAPFPENHQNSYVSRNELADDHSKDYIKQSFGFNGERTELLSGPAFFSGWTASLFQGK